MSNPPNKLSDHRFTEFSPDFQHDAAPTFEHDAADNVKLYLEKDRNERNGQVMKVLKED